MKENVDKYNDIINMPHHVSKKHPQMSIKNRAAQFGAFAALNGFEDEIEEEGRLTDKKIELTEQTKEIINNKLTIIQNKILMKPKVRIIYFIPDEKKNGGKYLTITGNIEKIDKDNNVIILDNKTKIKTSEIIDIEITK